MAKTKKSFYKECCNCQWIVNKSWQCVRLLTAFPLGKQPEVDLHQQDKPIKRIHSHDVDVWDIPFLFTDLKIYKNSAYLAISGGNEKL